MNNRTETLRTRYAPKNAATSALCAMADKVTRTFLLKGCDILLVVNHGSQSVGLSYFWKYFWQPQHVSAARFEQSDADTATRSLRLNQPNLHRGTKGPESSMNF